MLRRWLIRLLIGKEKSKAINFYLYKCSDHYYLIDREHAKEIRKLTDYFYLHDL